MTASNMSVLVIGLDGASPDKLFPWMDQGKLPHLAEIQRQGCSGPLETVLPAISTLAWPAFFAGKNPGNVGQFAVDLFENPRHPKSIAHINGRSVEGPAIWTLLSNAGKRVGVVNIPMTYPPISVNGFLIAGFLTPPASRNFTYPPSLISELDDYQIDIKFEKYCEVPDSGVDKGKLLELQKTISRKRCETCQKLIQKYRPDFFTVNFKGIDNVQHLFWQEEKVVLEFLSLIDELVFSLQKTMKPDFTIIISDHGFHDTNTHYFYLNAWLEQRGYLTRKSSLRSQLATRFLRLGFWLAEKSSFIRRIIPQRFKTSVRKRGPMEQINFESSIAYGSKYGIHINREILEKPDIAEKIKFEIIQELKDVKAPNGFPLVREILTRESLYKGPYLSEMPDLVFLLHDDYTALPTINYPLFSPRLDRLYLQGEHGKAPQGIFIMKGKDILQNKEVAVSLLDIAPTILHIMNVPLSTDFDGKILFQCFKEDSSLQKRQPEYVRPPEKERKESPLTEEEKEQIRKRLKALGYI